MRSTIARFASFAVLAGLSMTSGCALRAKGIAGNGQWASETRPLRNFSKVVLRAPFDAKVREGSDYLVTLWLDSNLQPYVKTTVTDDTLVIDATQLLDTRSHPTIDIRLPKLDGFSLEGAGKASIVGNTPHGAVGLAVNGSGDLAYEGKADKLEASLSGSGDMKLTGAVEHLDAEVKGSGTIDARAMPAVGGRFEIDGSGDILANLKGGDVACKISGPGDIRWLGKARVTSLDTRGGGTAGEL